MPLKRRLAIGLFALCGSLVFGTAFNFWMDPGVRIEWDDGTGRGGWGTVTFWKV